MAKKRSRPDHRSNRSSPNNIDSSRSLTSFFAHVREVLMLLSLAILVFFIYSNVLNGPLIFDDVPNIKNNPHIRLTKLDLGDITRAGFESPSSNRPVANVSFALNYYFHRYNVPGYHWANILIHVTAGIFLYLFVQTTLSLPSLRPRYEPHRWIPLIAVLIWLVHPLQTQSVTYIVQRMNSMAAMFYVLSLLLYAKARLAKTKGKKRSLFAGCILACLLSLGSKEIAVTLPFFIFLYEWYFFQDLSWAWLKRHSLPFAGILVFIAILAFMYLGAHPLEKLLRTYLARDFTVTQRVLTEFRVVIFYISLLIFPHPSRLNLDHDFPLSHSLIDPITTVLSIAAIAGLTGFGVFKAKKERLLSFCILWFLGNLVIESSVIGLEIIFEHRTYLPSMLVSLMAVTLAYRYVRSKRWRVGVLCVVVVVFSVWTYERNSVWDDDVTLWKDCVAKSPKKARPHLNLGVALNQLGRSKEAVNHFSEAIRIKPDYVDAHYNLGNAMKSQGKLKEAIGHYYQALRINPDYPDAHNNLGVVMVSKGKVEEAISHYHEALRINPDYGTAHNNLGIALADQGRLKEAISHYHEALRINPDDSDAHNNLGVVLNLQARVKEAISHFRAALMLEPFFPHALNNLSWVLATAEDENVRDGAMAIRQAKMACNLTKDTNPNFLDTLAAAFAETGRFREAIETAQKAKELAISANMPKIAKDIEKRMQLYRLSQPYRE